MDVIHFRYDVSLDSFVNEAFFVMRLYDDRLTWYKMWRFMLHTLIVHMLHLTTEPYFLLKGWMSWRIPGTRRKLDESVATRVCKGNPTHQNMLELILLFVI